MFAIFENGGKNYKVSVGTFVKLPKISSLKKNDSVSFKNVIFLKNEKDTMIGTPYLNNVVIKCKIVDNFRDKKIIVFKKKRRHNYRRKIGHRQDLTLLKVENIEVSKPSASIEKTLKADKKKESLTSSKENTNGT
tara:strand:+ start:405 stop:809 length:405 start_codon:yes stop_codon:yes gene_type:complete